MQILQVSDEVIFSVLISAIALFVLIVLLAGVVIIHHYEHRRNDQLTLSSLVSTITDFFLKANPKKEPLPSPLTSSIITYVSELEHNIELEPVEIAKTERVSKGIKALDGRSCCIMVFVLVASGIVLIWLLRPYFVPYVAFFLSYFGICCP